MDYQSLSRRQLQALCKQHRIPANTTNVAMAAALRDLADKEGCDMLIIPATPSSCKPSPALSAMPGRVTRSQMKKQQQPREDMIAAGGGTGNKKLFADVTLDKDKANDAVGGVGVIAQEQILQPLEEHLQSLTTADEQQVVKPSTLGEADGGESKRGDVTERPGQDVELKSVQPKSVEPAVDAEAGKPDVGLKSVEGQLASPTSPFVHDMHLASPGMEDSELMAEKGAGKASQFLSEETSGLTFPVSGCQLNQDSAEVEQLAHDLSAVSLDSSSSSAPMKSKLDKENLPLGFERFSLRQLKKFQKELYDKKMRKHYEQDVMPLSPNVSKNNCAH